MASMFACIVANMFIIVASVDGVPVAKARGVEEGGEGSGGV